MQRSQLLEVFLLRTKTKVLSLCLTYRVDSLDSGEQAGLVDRKSGGRASMDERLDDLQLHLLRLQVTFAHPLHHLQEAILTGDAINK